MSTTSEHSERESHEHWAASSSSADPIPEGESLGVPSESESQSPTDRQPEGYAREDWYGRDDDEVDPGGSRTTAGTGRSEKARSVAHKILRGAAPALCSVTINDPAKEAVELTEPEAYPHGEGNRPHMRAARVNPEHGYISGGESTGVMLGDLPAEEFFDVVEILLAIWQQTEHVSERGATILARDARRMKSSPEYRDEEIITALLEDVLSPEPVGIGGSN